MSEMTASIIAAPSRARSMLRVLAGLMLCCSAPTLAQEFSADLIRTQTGAAPVPAGRLIVHGDNVRIETPELSDGFFLVEGAKPAAYFVRPAMHLYMDARQSSRLTGWFVPVDPNDPCRQWQAMAQLAVGSLPDAMRCERTGEDIIGGRRLVAYRVIAGANERFLGWIDPAYGFPLRIKTRGGDIFAVENIQDAPQPLPLLQVPQGFRKFDPEMILRQVK